GRLAQARQLGRRIFYTPDVPEFGGSTAIEASPVDLRSVGYHAFLFESNVWLPQIAAWPADLSPAAALPPHVSRDWLLYPGAVAGIDRCIPSVRLKRLQRAAQDFEYLWLLCQNGRDATARLIAESLVKAGGSNAYMDNY